MTGTAENGWELAITRTIHAPPSKVWEIMTERLAEWWCPKPWRTEIIALEWVSGGVFHTAMYGPEPGQESSAGGMMLEVIPGRKFVFTDAFGDGWIPQKTVYDRHVRDFARRRRNALPRGRPPLESSRYGKTCRYGL
jgi:uncharacterized protein YndB with AHSA1/START domain